MSVKYWFYFVPLVLLLGFGVPCTAGNFIQISGTGFVDSTGQKFVSKGFGLGGWLVPEGYMLHIPGFGSPTDIRGKVQDLLGPDNAAEFWRRYRKNYIERRDIARIAAWGFNTVRVPFNYRLLSPMDQPGVYLEEGFAVLDSLIEWCRDSHLYVILDMHCAPGGQNADNISDSDGIEARLWTDVANRDRTTDLWQVIAGHYADEDVIIGYDLLNEPVLPSGYTGIDLRALYMRITNAIRVVDKNHILFIEGNWYATDFSDLTPQWDTKMAYTFHIYWSPPQISSIQKYLTIRKKYGVPLWMGESGENSNNWFYKMIQLLDANDISWSWWTNKKLQTTTSPYSAISNPAYDDVLAYWRGEKERPNRNYASAGLWAMADSLALDACRFLPDVLASITDPLYGASATSRVPSKAPGEIAAVNYDIGRDMVSYHDLDSENDGDGVVWNRGYAYRNDGVDIEPSKDIDGFPYSVGWINKDEWLTYTFEVMHSDTFDLEIRLASLPGNGAYQLFVDGHAVSEANNVDASGGWYNWENKPAATVFLTAGRHNLKILCIRDGFNLEKFIFTARNSVEITLPPKNFPGSLQLYPGYPNPFNSGTNIKYEIPAPGMVEINLFNIAGQHIHTLFSGKQDSGIHCYHLSGIGLGSGSYFIQVEFRSPSGVFLDRKVRSVILIK